MRLSRQLRRPVLVSLTVCAVAALSLPAGAASSSTVSKGAATSTLSILRLAVSGTTITAGQIAAVAGTTTSPHQVKLVVTPIDSTLTGPVGQQTITPSSNATSVPATPKSVALPAGLGRVTGPTFGVKATDDTAGVLASAALKALGQVTVLTVPLNLRAASLSDIAKVTSSKSTAKKSLSLGSLSLPSLNDLLPSLGLDVKGLLDELTQGKLTQLAGLVTSTTSGAVKSANGAVDAAQAAIAGAVPTNLDTAKTAVTSATGALTTATGAFNTAFGAIPTALLPAGVSTSTTADQFLALAPAVQAVVDALTASDLVSLAGAVQTVQDTVDSLQALVTALSDLINAVLAALTGDGDPLAALGNISVTTSAVAAKTPKANAGVDVGSVRVLGALTPLTSLTKTLGTVTDTLSSVLESVAGVSFTAPKLTIGKPTKSTKTTGRTRFASASITGVKLTLPSLTLPNALALPGVPSGISGSLTFGQLSDTAQFTPGTAATPTTPTPRTSTPNGSPLPDTGGRMLLPVAGLLIIGSALLLRRRLRATGTTDGTA